MRLGILSDSHKKLGRLKKVLSLFQMRGVDFIIHGGDWVNKESLLLLKESTIPYIAVLGNNDFIASSEYATYNVVEEPHSFIYNEIAIKLMHHPYWLQDNHDENHDLIIYGHTHQQYCQKNIKTLILNSGEVSARNRNKSQAMIVDILPDTIKVTQLNRKIKTLQWVEEVKEFIR